MVERDLSPEYLASLKSRLEGPAPRQTRPVRPPHDPRPS